jgi:ribonuclease HII
MVVAAAAMTLAQEKHLRRAGVRDSKALSPRRRQELKPIIEEVSTRWAIREIPPDLLDQRSLNAIDIDATADLLAEVGAPRAILDVPSRGRGIQRYVMAVHHRLGPDHQLHIEGFNHADRDFIPVSAASILAKVHRDRALEELRDRYGEVGSGYPSDPKTRCFLMDWVRRYGDLPPFARRKWSTAKRALATLSEPMRISS